MPHFLLLITFMDLSKPHYICAPFLGVNYHFNPSVNHVFTPVSQSLSRPVPRQSKPVHRPLSSIFLHFRETLHLSFSSLFFLAIIYHFRCSSLQSKPLILLFLDFFFIFLFVLCICSKSNSKSNPKSDRNVCSVHLL